MRAITFVAALLTASSAIAQTAPPAPPDPAHMSRAQLQAEVEASRPLVQFRGVNENRPAGCTSPESRQFDFWIGEWDVSPTGQSMVVAESTISLEDQGCTIIEFWRAFGSAHGHSINGYDTTDQAWHQMWVDATGRVTPYAGRFENGVMHLANLGAPPPNAGPDFHRRMNFQQIDANTVRQWGEYQSNATHAEWMVAWDFTYHRRPGTHP